MLHVHRHIYIHVQDTMECREGWRNARVQLTGQHVYIIHAVVHMTEHFCIITPKQTIFKAPWVSDMVVNFGLGTDMQEDLSCPLYYARKTLPL